MNSDWESVRLGDVTHQVRDSFPVEPDESYVSLGLRMRGQGVFARPAKQGREIKGTTLYRVRSGQFIYNRMFASGGSFGLVPNGLADGVVSNEFPVFDTDPYRLLPQYLNLYFTRPPIWKVIETECTGTTKSRLRWNEQKFSNFKVDLPPLAEQRRIVDLIDSLDDAIEASQVAISQLVSVQSATLASQILRETEPKRILGSVFEHVIGGSWGSPLGEEDVEVSAIGPSAYAGGRIDVDPSLGSPRSLSEKRTSVRELKPGDIVLERSGGSPTQPVGRVLRMNSEDKRIVPSDFMRLLRVDASIVEPSFVFWFLWALYRTGASEPFQKFTTGIRNLNIPDYLHSTTIHIPEDPAERARIVDLAESMAATVSMAKEKTLRLQALRSETLTALVSGAHTIPESYDELMGGRAS